MENTETLKNTYDLLKESLLNGELTPEEVRRELISMDQETPNRDASEQNLIFLQDPEVVEFIDSKPEYLSNYKATLAFTEFHVAQRLVFKEDKLAIKYFKDSLSHIMEANDGEDSPSSFYTKGTILYLEGKQIPEDFILKAEIPSHENQNNMEIMRKFNTGLKERGYPDYNTDYYL